MNQLKFLFSQCRVEKVLYEIQRRSPFMTDAEKQMGQQLRLLETKLHALSQSMESLKRREQLCGVKVKSFIGMSRFAMQTNVFFFYA